MNLETQYTLFVNAIMTAIDNCMDDIPGDEIDSAALFGALGYAIYQVAQSHDEPDVAMSRFLTRLIAAHHSLSAEESHG